MSLASLTCQKPWLASRTLKTLALGVMLIRSSTVCMGKCSRMTTPLRSLGSRHTLSLLFFFVATTRLCTQAVGSLNFLKTPSFSIFSVKLLFKRLAKGHRNPSGRVHNRERTGIVLDAFNLTQTLKHVCMLEFQVFFFKVVNSLYEPKSRQDFNPRMDGKSCLMSMKSTKVNFPLYLQVRLILPLGVIRRPSYTFGCFSARTKAVRRTKLIFHFRRWKKKQGARDKLCISSWLSSYGWRSRDSLKGF